jgi:ATP/maltotriose-dependent transcriptional regulator MalT
LLRVSRPAQPPAEVKTDTIVGRRREIEALRSWLEAAHRGSGRLVLCVGEPGIGKTRLAQELAGIALAAGITVAWGRCGGAEGAPAFWPWRQVLRSLGVAPDTIFAGEVESPEDRFRVFEDVTATVQSVAAKSGLVVILDDIHWSDEPSLLVLRHLAEQIAGTKVLLFAAFRDAEPGSALPRVLPDLLRSPAIERLDLRGFGLAEVREHLSRTAASESTAEAEAVLDVTGGNPFLVREVARAIADGTWRPDRPPLTVLDIVSARLDRVSAECRRLMQAAAIAGRDFSLSLVAAALDEPIAQCLPLIDEAAAFGLVDRVGDPGNYRFVHALIRDAVEATLPTADRAALHRAVAETIEEQFGSELSEHLVDIAHHWAELAPYGEGARARTWAIRAADDAVGRLAYEEGVRLYRAALALDATPLPDDDRCRVLIALGRAAYFAGDLDGCARAAVGAMRAARAADDLELVREAALAVEAAPDPSVNAVAKQLCEDAIAFAGDDAPKAVRARLLAQRSHLAFYDGEQDLVESLSEAALGLARESHDDHALRDALHARKEARPGPEGRTERLQLAGEMVAVAQRTNSARTAMWGELWQIEALLESGQLRTAADRLPTLQVAVDRVGGPVSAWHLDRVTACIAQAQGRYADAADTGRRGFERMRPIEPGPATGAYFALVCAITRHVGVADEAAAFLERPLSPLPRFRTIGPLHRAFLSLLAGRTDEAAAAYQQAGPIEAWSLPAFFILPGYAYATLVAAQLGRHDDVEVLLDRLEPFRGEHAIGEGVAYMGPVELALGRGAAALGRMDAAIDELARASEQADTAGAAGFVAEAEYHLAAALLMRNGEGDHERARAAARTADRLARALGMTPYIDRTAALLAQLGGGPTVLSPREADVAKLVAEGLTNRQIAERLVISERTAQNHVQHILTKLGFTTRTQIAAWSVRRNEYADE